MLGQDLSQGQTSGYPIALNGGATRGLGGLDTSPSRFLVKSNFEFRLNYKSKILRRGNILANHFQCRGSLILQLPLRNQMLGIGIRNW